MFPGLYTKLHSGQPCVHRSTTCHQPWESVNPAAFLSRFSPFRNHLLCVELLRYHAIPYWQIAISAQSTNKHMYPHLFAYNTNNWFPSCFWSSLLFFFFLSFSLFLYIFSIFLIFLNPHEIPPDHYDGLTADVHVMTTFKCFTNLDQVSLNFEAL